jgi:hypothetical protein
VLNTIVFPSMTVRMRLPTLCVGLLLSASFALAAQEKLPPVREISVRMAVSSDSFGRVEAVIASNGAATVVDYPRRRVIRLDPTLAESITLFDQQSPQPLTMPTVPPRLFLGQADTVYMTDLPNRGGRVIAPDGQVVRRLGFADYEDLVRITNLNGGAQFGSRGDVYFAATLARRNPGDFSAEPHDSLLLVHVAGPRSDTLGVINLKRTTVTVPDDSVPGQPRSGTAYWAPFEIGDAMALNTRGELAVIRASDFHVDWLMPDGRWRQSAPVAWSWKRFSADEKQRIQAAHDSVLNTGNVMMLQRQGAPRPRIVMKSAPVPDREPAFAPMSAIADPNGLVWLQLGPKTVASEYGRMVYGAIDGTGQIVDRISLPPSRRLIGISKAGNIYAAGLGRIEVYRGNR